MRLAALLATQFLLVAFPNRFMVIANLILFLGLSVTASKRWKPLTYILGFLLVAIPFSFLPLYQPRSLEPPSEAQILQLGNQLQLHSVLTEQAREPINRLLESRSAGIHNDMAPSLLADVSLPTYTSLTVINLNREAVSWKGTFFSEEWPTLQADDPRFVMKDGRLYLQCVHRIEKNEATIGYVTVELLITSQHFAERDHSWLVQQDATYRNFRAVVVEPKASDFLYQHSSILELEPHPFDIFFIRELAQSPTLDGLAFLWTLLLVVGLFVLARHLDSRMQAVAYAVYLASLFLGNNHELDFLNAFASFVFGSDSFGPFLATPFHALISLCLTYLLLVTLKKSWRALSSWLPYVWFVGSCATVLGAPDYLQYIAGFSLVHPLEAFNSTGTLLSYVTFLLVFVFLVVIGDMGKPVSRRRRWTWIVGALIPLGWFFPDQWLALISLALCWEIRDRGMPLYLRTALVVLAFYPHLVIQEQTREIDFVRHELLDELTLMRERNYFRMGRLIPFKDELVAASIAEPYSQLMEMVAKKSGWLEDDIDFALRLSDPQGKMVSEIEQHISLQTVPYFRAAWDTIEIIEHPNNLFQWMVYRTQIPTPQGHFEFLAVLGNDYRNFSLVRQLRQLQDREYSGYTKHPVPYFAYILDVFTGDGTPFYSQNRPNPLTRQERMGLDMSPTFQYVTGRNSIFLFHDGDYIYRITHKATPLKMIFVRFLAILLSMLLLVQLVRLSHWPGRNPIALWKRSFSIKMAGFMFLISILPTLTLGFFLLQSIKKNQAREAENIARSKIVTAKNLFGDSQYGDPTGHLQGLPLEEYAAIVDEDLSLFRAGSLVRTNQPELFRQGWMGRRLPFEMARDLMVARRSYTLEQRPFGSGRSLLIAYTPLSQGPKLDTVLAMTMIPFSRMQELRWREQWEFSGAVLFGILMLMAGLARFFARSFLRPVAAITRGASRLARGLQNRPIIIHRQDELELMVHAFNTMRERIAESREKLKDQLGLLDETLKSMSSGLVGFDRHGRVILQNDMAWQLLNLKESPSDLSELLNQVAALVPVRDFFERGVQGELAATLMERGEPQELAVKLRHVHDRRVGDIRSILVIEDITDALAASRFKAWAEMARRVAHEIKNPLTPIQLEMDHLTQLFRDQHPRFDEALSEAAQEIRMQVEHLRRIATEFSDYARPLEPDFEETDLGDLIEQIVAPYRKTLLDLDIQVHVSGTAKADLDPRLFRRAIHNLIINAIQAMGKQGRLGLSVARDADGWEIGIEDSGPGIPEEVQHQIFDAYFTTKDRGSGLGLVIAKKYIQSHQGSLRVDKQYDRGTRFVIHIPIRQEPGAGDL